MNPFQTPYKQKLSQFRTRIAKTQFQQFKKSVRLRMLSEMRQQKVNQNINSKKSAQNSEKLQQKTKIVNYQIKVIQQGENAQIFKLIIKNDEKGQQRMVNQEQETKKDGDKKQEEREKKQEKRKNKQVINKVKEENVREYSKTTKSKLRWNPDQQVQYQDLHTKGFNNRQIANKLQRSYRSVQNKSQRKKK